MESAKKRKYMRNLKRLACLLALTGIFHAPLQAHDKGFGYLHDKNGELVLNSLGECIRTSSWTAETAIPKCEGIEEEKVTDADQDGIADNSDKCPGTASGVTVDNSGCEIVSASIEPEDSAVIAPVVAPKDTDNDGIVDSKDQCPDSKPGENVDNKGCKLQETYVLEGVNFETGSDTIAAESESVLAGVVEAMNRNGDVIVEVAGYTDDRGESNYNQSLSQKRAEAVKAYLQSSGIAADRMTAKGYGEESPIADNSTAEGRAKNRRVELHIIN